MIGYCCIYLQFLGAFWCVENKINFVFSSPIFELAASTVDKTLDTHGCKSVTPSDHFVHGFGYRIPLNHNHAHIEKSEVFISTAEYADVPFLDLFAILVPILIDRCRFRLLDDDCYPNDSSLSGISDTS